MDGSFVEQLTDEHVRLRRDVLERGTPLRTQGREAICARVAGFPTNGGDALLSALRESGLALVQLDAPLADDAFITLGALLGTTMPETAPAVLPFVEHGVILNLVSAHAHTPDADLQPFARNFLTLHTESSGRPAEEQPRYIVLMCCDPGDDATSAQTVLVPMTAVARRLTASQIAVLSRTRYRQSHRGPLLVRTVGGRQVFSFRDFLSQTLAWTYTGDDRDAEAVNAAIRALLAAMYAPDAAIGITWRRGLLVIIDNTFFFHGRTAGSAAVSNRRRHLKRLRIG